LGVRADLEHGVHRGAFGDATRIAHDLFVLALRLLSRLFFCLGEGRWLAVSQYALGVRAPSGDVLMHAGYLGGVWAAVHFGMGAGLSALVVGLQPVLTGIWLSYAGDRVSGRQWLGLALGLLGLLMVVANKLTHVGEVSPLTLALVTVGLLSITVGTLYQKRYVKPCDVRTASTVQLMAAFLVTIPFAWLEDSPLVWVPDLVIAMTWSVLALTLGASSLLYLLIQRGAAAAVSSLMYLVPPCTALVAWFLFDEALTFMTVLGMAVTVTGVALVRPKAVKAT